MPFSLSLKWLSRTLVLAGALLAAGCGSQDSASLLTSAGGASPLSTQAAAFTLKPITWNVVGLDSNNVAVGPNIFPVGVRVTNSGDAAASNVTATFRFTTANANINLNGSSTVTLATLAPGASADFYFEVVITRNAAAYDTARRYVIDVAATGVPAVSTPSPREIYVKRFVSQNRNQIQGISGPTAVNVGDTATYVLDASTAPGGYEQLSTSLNFPTDKFQVLSTAVTYTAPAGGTNNQIYADACGWQPDPTLAGYLSCVGPAQYPGGKAGGTIKVTYVVKITGAGTTNVTGLIYDFSGASFHFNSDFGLTVLTIVASNPTNRAPTANDDTYSTPAGMALTVTAPGVLANDTDPEMNPLTAIRVSGPTNGTLTLNANGSFTYTPNAGFVGVDSFTYKANDGSLDSAAATVRINVGVLDTTIVSGPPALTNSSSATFDFSSNVSPVTYECSLDSGPFVACTDPVTFTGLANGNHTLSVRAKDSAGNVDTTPATYSWTVDTNPPDTTIVSGPPLTGAPSTATFDFSSNETPVTYECRLDGGTYAPCTDPVTFTGLADGPHTLDVRAVDAAGNVDPTPATYTWTVGSTPPTPPNTTIVSGPPSVSSSPNATFDFSSDKSPVTYECRLDGGAFTPCTDLGTFTGLADGPHTLEVRAKDMDGNVDPTPATYTWTIARDDDGDGLTNTEEGTLGTDPNDPDTDHDGLPDGIEVVGGTNPLDPDSDHDGLPDGVEDGNHNGSVDSGETNPRDPDSDDDGLTDGTEDANHNGSVDSGETDPLDPDTDHGGVNDGDEVARGSDPLWSFDDRERVVVGSGCSATGDASGSVLALAFGLLLLLRRRPVPVRKLVRRSSTLLAAIGAVTALAVPASARAQGTTSSRSSAIDVQQFKPAAGQADVLGLFSPGVPGHLSWRAGFFLNYADDPLVMIDRADRSLYLRLVDNQLGVDLLGAVGIGERFEVSALLPVSVQYGMSSLEGTTPPSGWGGGLGDLRLTGKALLFEREHLRLGVVLPLVLPTAGATAFRGQAGVGASPRVTGEYAFSSGIRVLANLGANLRSQQTLLNLTVGSELAYGVGAAIPFQVRGHALEGLASLAGAVGLFARQLNEEEAPLEVQGAVRYRINPNLIATVGVGRGIIRGYGMPNFRLLGGLAWADETRRAAPPPPAPPADSDGDGIVDTEDKCPLQAEDKDGFQDEDGCPDLDNDQDGIPDAQDKCPLEAEDKDGFQDEDGCPDLDNDQDGIPDAQDKCPNKAEDKDGFQDDDGCPDPDNDGDGIPDVKDKCPNEPEVINNVEDDDGCPDKGESKVRIEGKKIVILEKVYFATNKDVVLPRSFPLLQQVSAVLRTNPQLKKVRVEGHTDDRGNDAANLDLSQRRANTVRNYLVQQGIAPERLEAVGYGETQPVDTNKTAAGRENNRRVVFTILEVEE